MAKFEGTNQEFHRVIGPRIKNQVNGLTRNHRKVRNGKCEHCPDRGPDHAELHSAHVRGRERPTIINQVLREYTNERGMISGLLEEIEFKILQAHLPIEDTFIFLCQKCHWAYDSGNGKADDRPAAKKIPSGSVGDHGGNEHFEKLDRIPLWAQKPRQINHRIVCVFRRLEQHGPVELSTLRRYCTEDLRISRFDGNYNSMKTDAGNSHGKVFFDDGSIVKMYDQVRREVDKYFHKPCC
jgi:hypothetical protein